MSNMQAFRKRLFAPVNTNNAHQRRLVRLTQVSRTQILNAIGELTWFIWDADKAATA
jgi:hypothetical protein